jgi:flagellar motor component MotA
MIKAFGFLLIFLIIVIAILMGGSLKTFVDPFALIFVIAGPICLVLVSFETREIAGAMRNIFKRESVSEDARVSIIIFKTLSSYSMAFGALLGLIGYVTMLAQAEDPNELPFMIAALLIGPLYGLFLGQFIYLPLATYMENKRKE